MATSAVVATTAGPWPRPVRAATTQPTAAFTQQVGTLYDQHDPSWQNGTPSVWAGSIRTGMNWTRLLVDVVSIANNPRVGAQIVRALAATRRPPSETLQRIERRRDELSTSTQPFWNRTVGEHTVVASKPPRAARFLHELVRLIRPRSAVEMGTAVGISGAYIAAALPPGGRLVTLEGNRVVASVARETFAGLGLGNVEVVEGQFADMLQPTLEDLGPVDFLFVDGHHAEEATLAYFDAASQHLAKEAVIVFDDIHWTDGMERAWHKLRRDSRLTSTASLGSLGVARFSG